MQLTRPLAALVLASLLIAAAGSCSRPRRIRVGSKNFTEQAILGELIALHLEKELGAPVERMLNLGGAELTHQALMTRQIDLYPESTGTAIVTILKQEPDTDRGVRLQHCRNEYANQFQVDWMDPLGFDSGFILAAAGDRARKDALTTISGAAVIEDGWKPGVSAEFELRKDGLSNLQRNYHLRLEAAPKILDPTALYRVVAEKRVDLVAALATDGVLPTLDVRILADDKGIFPAYETAIVARRDTLSENPKLRAALAKLSGKLTTETMRQLNLQVDGKKRPAAQVAADFLKTIR